MFLPFRYSMLFLLVVAMSACDEELYKTPEDRSKESPYVPALHKVEFDKTSPIDSAWIALNKKRIKFGLKPIEDNWTKARCRFPKHGMEYHVLLNKEREIEKLVLQDISELFVQNDFLEMDVQDGKFNGRGMRSFKGRVNRVETFENNQLSGLTMWLDDDEIPICSLEYKNHKPWSGEEFWYFENDKDYFSKISFKDGVNHGPTVSYHFGDLIAEDIYVEGDLRSEKDFYKDSLGIRPALEALTKNGNPVYSIKWFPNGLVTHISEYRFPDSTLWYWSEWHEDGTLKKSGGYKNRSEIGIHYKKVNGEIQENWHWPGTWVSKEDFEKKKAELGDTSWEALFEEQYRKNIEKADSFKRIKYTSKG